MGCTGSKNDIKSNTSAPSNTSASPNNNNKNDVNKNENKAKGNEKAKESAAEKSEIIDKENRINLVFRLKRQNLFNHGYDIGGSEQSTFTATSIPKTPQQTELIRKALGENFIFAGVGEDELNLLVNAMGIVSICANEFVITQGSEGDFFYVVDSGSYTVLKDNVPVITLGPGKSFGELALLSNTPRQASIRADTPGVLYSLDRDTFRYTLANSSASRSTIITRALAKVPLLSGLTSDQLNKISDSVELVRYGPGEFIITKGAEGNVFYIIHEGRVKITDVGTTSQYNDHELESGHFFGERALITGEPRAANVVAVTPVTLMALDRHSFSTILGPLREVIEFNSNLMLINNIRIFENLDDHERDEVIRNFSTELFPAGSVILRQGEKGNKFYVLREGSVKVSINGQDVGNLEAGQYFGELALLDDEIRKATITASTKVECFVLDRQTFDRILGSLQTIISRNNSPHGRVKSWMDKLSSVEKIQLSMSDLNEIGLLGSGTFGRVTLVQNKTTKKVYALKAMLKHEIVTHRQENNVIQEKNVMIDSDHPFILHLYATFKDQRFIFMLLEFVQGGELFSIIHTSRSDGISDEQSKFYGACIIQAVSYLHQRDIAYRDMKPENCLVDNLGYPKLIDFGFAKKIKNGKTFTLCGTPEYLAPEIVLGRGHNKAVDYWAFGVLLYEMQAGYSPFCDPHGVDQVVICKNIVNGRLIFPRRFNTDCKDLIRQLLKTDVGSRLGNLRGGCEDIIKHPWFDSIDVDKLLQKKLKAPWAPKVSNPFDLSNFEGAESKSRNLGPVIDCSSWDHEF